MKLTKQQIEEITRKHIKPGWMITTQNRMRQCIAALEEALQISEAPQAPVGNGLEYSASQILAEPEVWAVEAVDFDNEGVIYATIFHGPKAQQRAEEYAAFKNAEPKC